MSVQIMSRVWNRSRQSGGALLVLLAIADFADDRGLAYPSVRTLARKARLSERHVQRVIGELVAANELVVEPTRGLRGVHLFRILVDGRDPRSADPRQDVVGGSWRPRHPVMGDTMSLHPRRPRRAGVTPATLAWVTPAASEPSSPEPSGTITPLPPSPRQRGVDVDRDEPTGPRAPRHTTSPDASPSPALLVDALYRGLGVDRGELTRTMLARELAIAGQLIEAGATVDEAEAYARDAGTAGNRLAPIDMRSFERERPSWLARRRVSRAGGGRYVDRTGQGIQGVLAPPSVPDPSAIDTFGSAGMLPARRFSPQPGHPTNKPEVSRPAADWQVTLGQRLLGNTA
jgi:hypothetical protein